MLHWTELFKITIALLAIVNPVGGVPMYVGTTAGWTPAEQRRTARTVAITVFTVLGTSALVGTSLLDFFGIGIPSFQVGGGILLMLLAISMMQARESGIRQTPAEERETVDRHAVAVVPLGIPLLAGPGSISTMIISTHGVQGVAFRFELLLPAALIAVTVWMTLLLATRVSRRLGTTGMNIVTRIMGLVLAALAVEFIAQGLLELFPGLGGKT
jgi:multiple antibiotic resistance protein